MEIKIKDKKENVLLNRTDIEAEITHQNEPTPSRFKIKEKLAAMLSADKNLLVIKKLDQTFGSTTKCTAVLYKSKADLEDTEKEHLIKRDAKKPKEEKKEEPKPKETKPEEKKTQPETKEVSSASTSG